ncbi:chorismate-binding protein, partial [Pantoea sp. SIMBA_072]
AKAQPVLNQYLDRFKLETLPAPEFVRTPGYLIDGEWVVTIRCAEAFDRTLRLYAGAGVVGESTPDGERAETAAKFRTMLDALGID